MLLLSPGPPPPICNSFLLPNSPPANQELLVVALGHKLSWAVQRCTRIVCQYVFTGLDYQKLCTQKLGGQDPVHSFQNKHRDGQNAKAGIMSGRATHKLNRVSAVCPTWDK